MVVGHSICHYDLHSRGNVEVRKTQPVRAAGADSPPEFAIFAGRAASALALPNEANPPGSLARYYAKQSRHPRLNQKGRRPWRRELPIRLMLPEIGAGPAVTRGILLQFQIAQLDLCLLYLLGFLHNDPPSPAFPAMSRPGDRD